MGTDTDPGTQRPPQADMLLVPQLLCLLCLMALGTVHASPSAEIKLERGNCPMFWYSFNGRCFNYVPTRMSWSAAEDNCQSQDAHLASIHSDEEHDFIQALIQNFDPSQLHTWIGLNELYVEGRWMWSDGSIVNYIRWGGGQPDDGTDDTCIFTFSGNEMHDYPCSIDTFPSVCALRTE